MLYLIAEESAVFRVCCTKPKPQSPSMLWALFTEGFLQGNGVVSFISMASPCSGKMYPSSPSSPSFPISPSPQHLFSSPYLLLWAPFGVWLPHSPLEGASWWVPLNVNHEWTWRNRAPEWWGWGVWPLIRQQYQAWERGARKSGSPSPMQQKRSILCPTPSCSRGFSFSKNTPK